MFMKLKQVTFHESRCLWGCMEASGAVKKEEPIQKQREMKCRMVGERVAP